MVLARTRPPVRPTVRLRPAPALDPPFDDEYAPETWLGGAPPPGLAVGPAAERLRSVGAGARRAGRSGADPTSSAGSTRRTAPLVIPPDPAAQTITSRPTASAYAGATPEAKQAAKRFLDTCLEIINGYRPAGHVRALASPTDAAGLVEQLASAASRISGRRRPGQPVRTVRLRRLRVCEPRSGVIEAAAAVGVAGRTWAMAFRLERRRGSWVGISAALL